MRPVTMQPCTPRSRIFAIAESTRGRSRNSSPSSVPSKSNATNLYFMRVVLRRAILSRSKESRPRVLREPLELGERRKGLCVPCHALRAVFQHAEGAHEIAGVQAGRETRRAGGRQHVIGTRNIIAARHRRLPADEYRAGMV